MSKSRILQKLKTIERKIGEVKLQLDPMKSDLFSDLWGKMDDAQYKVAETIARLEEPNATLPDLSHPSAQSRTGLPSGNQ